MSTTISGLISDVMPDELDSSGIFRYALGIEYKGTNYIGWQRQECRNSLQAPVVNSVQAQVESALEYVADESITSICAGRTDRGVHARGQVVHFDTRSRRPLKAWVLGTNSRLPPDISVQWAKQVGMNFHARFSAVSRTYHYWINNRMQRPAVDSELMTWVSYPLDAEVMHRGAQYLLGERDFSSFRSTSCQSNTPFRFVEHLSVERMQDRILVQITANAFLHHMVRNIVGALLDVGKGLKSAEWMAELLDLRDRNRAGITAAPNGLFLMHVDYPAQFQLPQGTSRW